MNEDKNKNRDSEQDRKLPDNNARKQPRSGAFNEPNIRDEKSTTNIEEANLEQERKEAMTERD
jgi:hypothetical protein